MREVSLILIIHKEARTCVTGRVHAEGQAWCRGTSVFCTLDAPNRPNLRVKAFPRFPCLVALLRTSSRASIPACERVLARILIPRRMEAPLRFTLSFVKSLRLLPLELDRCYIPFIIIFPYVLLLEIDKRFDFYRICTLLDFGVYADSCNSNFQRRNYYNY